MCDAAGGGGYFRDDGVEEQEIRLAKYILPSGAIGADICISQNMRSLTKNFGKLEDYVARHNNIPIIALQEIWTPILPPQLRGYSKLIGRQRSKKGGGGVGFFIKDPITYTIVQSPFIEGELETLCLDIKLSKTRTVRVLNIYRPPDVSPTLFINAISDLPLATTHRNIVLGDINIDILDVRKNGLIEVFAERGLGSLIDIPTRIFKKSATCIDHIYTDIKSSASFVIENDISDHFTVSLTLNSKATKNKSLPETYDAPLHDERSLDYLKQYFRAYGKSTEWKEILNCKTPEAFDLFEKVLREAILICCPTVTKNRSKIPINPWFTPELIELRAEKEKLHRKARTKRTDESWEAYRETNKWYNKECRKAKNEYYAEQINMAKDNGKKLWEITNEVTGRPTKKSKSGAVGPIEGCSNDVETATKINTFFATVAAKLKDQIKKSKKSYKHYLPPRDEDDANDVLELRSVSCEKVDKIIDNMKSKTSFSHDTMSNKQLKHIKDEILVPLTHLINVSIKCSFIPKSWKTAKMVPIFKSGDRSQPTNYRPISLLPTMSKVLERAVSNQVYGYFERTKKLYNLQFGYRQGYSTEGLLLKILDYVAKRRSDNKHVLNVYIDLRKAFDTVPYDILFEKLSYYGLSKSTVDWFRSYLSERRMYTKVADSESGMEDILCGVPQGSILGPLLFLIFINDLPHSTKLLTALYCDDTTFAHHSNNLETLFSETNEMLASIEDWFDANFLSLHPGKTRFMLFTTPKESKTSTHKLFLQGKEVQRVHENGEETSFKLVGVHLDEGLTFKHHIKHVHKKIIGMTAIIKRSRKLLTSRIKKMLFHALVQSHLQYCLSIWGGAADGLLKPLRISQKKAARIACGVRGNKHSEPCFSNLGALKLEDLYITACAKIAVKHVADIQTEGLQDCFEKACNKKRKERVTRLQNSDNLKVPRMDAQWLRHLPAYKIPKMWNEKISANIRDMGPIIIDSAYKSQTLLNYADYKCEKADCFSCNN